MKTTTPAPRRLRLKNVAVSTSLPPGASAVLDSLVGSFLGSTRAEVMRYMAINWITDHIGVAREIVKSRGV